MVRVKGFGAFSPEDLGDKIDNFFKGKNFSSLDIQYKVHIDPSYTLNGKRYNALIIYEDGECYCE